MIDAFLCFILRLESPPGIASAPKDEKNPVREHQEDYGVPGPGRREHQARGGTSAPRGAKGLLIRKSGKAFKYRLIFAKKGSFLGF
jgi:hypothetical protein